MNKVIHQSFTLLTDVMCKYSKEQQEDLRKEHDCSCTGALDRAWIVNDYAVLFFFANMVVFKSWPHAEHIFCFPALPHLTRVLKDWVMSWWGESQMSSGRMNAGSCNTQGQEWSRETLGLRNWPQCWGSVLMACSWSDFTGATQKPCLFLDLRQRPDIIGRIISCFPWFGL